ncbi:PREDICTED: uncharacterized protein LOC108978708 [Bactrocera latifrons]|uniref:Uncharacterized protein n=1 Tax=Bactrocera latifrons TaxID=174628 RepID=A0A0K8VST0_BACLA|nr:PREDICTED: uncharacterized protein LOC108978708 [Bactrocera latifrons]
MYQHIQLRRSSNWSSKAISQKVNASNVFKEKEVIEIYDDDDVLVLKELSNKMDELEEVILVEDDDALSLPQLSNESWDDFVDELTKKYEYDALQTTSVPQTTTAKRKFHISARNLSRAQRGYAATRDDSVISISSDEDEQSSTVLPSEQTHSSRKDFSSMTQVPSATNSCTSPSQCELLTSVVNEGIKSLEEENKLDSGQPIEHIATAAIERVNNETTQSTEPNLTLLAADTQNPIEHNVMTETNSSTTCTDNITLSESLRSKAPSLSKHKGLSGINKKYHDIKRRTYKLTFHQILQIFDIEGAALSAIGAVPGEPIDLDFPDFDMREFVKIVKNYQETESVDDVRHLWTQIKSWLSAMKPAYGTTTNYTKYHKKLNWYLSELMAQYIKFEIEHSIQNENYYKLKMEALMHTVSSLLNDDVNLKILTLLRTNFPDRPSNFLDDLFKKFLTHPKVRLENNDYGIYRLKVLAFQKWMHYSNRKKEDIVDIAIKEGSAYLPRLVPKNTEDPFYRVDYNVQLIDDYDKQGTRKILAENVSIDVLKNTINNYLLVYERQLFDDIVYRLSRRQCLEHLLTRYQLSYTN